MGEPLFIHTGLSRALTNCCDCFQGLGEILFPPFEDYADPMWTPPSPISSDPILACINTPVRRQRRVTLHPTWTDFDENGPFAGAMPAASVPASTGCTERLT